MKLKFTRKAYQTAAVEAVADCFAGQPKVEHTKYRVDPGTSKEYHSEMEKSDGFRNHKIELTPGQLLSNINAVQRSQNLPLSEDLKHTVNCHYNLDVEMETGTGKTYCYIKSMFELNRRYGWSKFIIVVPSIAIREGVQKSLDLMSDHFLEEYHKSIKSFVYDSKQLHKIDAYSSDAGINVMVINVQAFNARGKDARRIYEELDDFQSRRPIDVLKANHPIMILDEPQKMEGKKTMESLKEFSPLLVLRYSATHKTTHNKIHRLDALDAYNQKLVKKISVRGITTRGLSGTNGYLYLESIEVSKHSPVARMEIEVKTKSGIKRVLRKISHNDNLQVISEGLNQYDGFVVADIDAIRNTVSFTNGIEIEAGVAYNDENEDLLRRIQIRETIRAHFEKEQTLFYQGIKVLSLFFIDSVAKYRSYGVDSEVIPGLYAQIFEEEYNAQLNEVLELDDSPYQQYLRGIDVNRTHNGYFSIDKKGKLTDPKIKRAGEDKGHSDDVDAYDLILKDKERLLSHSEPVRFIFSHSALREGWDNPNVFVICTLKHSDNKVSRRQEVGRGMRLCVNQFGERMDNPTTAHRINILTVVANESYKDFVKGLQTDLSTTLSERPKAADAAFFEGKVMQTTAGAVEVTPVMAKQIYKYLLKNDYTNEEDDTIATAYLEAKKEGTLAQLPAELEKYAEEVFKLIDSVYSPDSGPHIGNDRDQKTNPLNQNFHKKEFQELWNKINQKAAYTVNFDSNELVAKCVTELDANLKVTPLQFTVTKGEQVSSMTYDGLKGGESFSLKENSTLSHQHSVHSSVKYDLIGSIAELTQLTRKTVTAILTGINKAVFGEYKRNPEEFINKACKLIKEQKACAVIEHLSYDPINDRHDVKIFTEAQSGTDFSGAFKADNHVFDYVVTDSKGERKFVEHLDTSAEVVVYAKLPRGFSIPTPMGDYNPDWAIAFHDDKIKHIFFIAETKGSMSTLELKGVELGKVKSAKKFFEKLTTDKVKYDVVDSYEELINMVGAV